MSLLKLFTTPYEIVRATVNAEADEDTGDDVTTLSEPEADVHRTCWFEQTASSETNGDRTQEAVTAFAAFKAGTTITAADLVVIDGDRWSIVGRPHRVQRRGVEHHVECQLQLVT